MPAIHFDITGDNDNVIKALQETVDNLEQFSEISKRFSEAGVDFKDTATAIKGIEEYINGLNGALDGCADKIEELNKKIAEASMSGDQAAVAQYKEELEEVISTQEQLTEEVSSSQSALDMLKDSFDDTAESAGKTEGVMVRLLGGTKNYNEIIKNLPGPLKSVVTGLNGMVKAAKAFIATPLGMALTPLILAFSALSTWLHKSAEGQQALAKISGYLKGVIAGMQQVVMDIGKALYNAFNDPIKALDNLWQALKKNFIDKMNASAGIVVNFGKMVGKAFSGKWDEAKEAAKEMGDSFNKLVDSSAIGKVYDSVTGYVEGINKIGKAQSDLSARENKLHRERTAWMIQEAELDKQIAEQRNKMRMGTKEERSEAAAKMQELINQKTAKNVELAREEYNIKKETNALTTSSQEDLDEEERLRARVVQLETQGVTQKGFALRIQDSMNRQLGISAEKLKELVEKEKELIDALTEKGDQQILESTSLAVSAMEDGFKKEMAEQELEHTQRMAAIDKEQKERIKQIEDFQKAEYKARHGSLNGFVFDENSEMMAAAMEIYDKEVENEGERSRQALSNIYKSYLDEYKDFIDQWSDLSKKFNNDRLALIMAGADKFNPKVFQELGEKEREAFEGLAEQWATSGRDKGFTKWFEELKQQSLVDLDIMLSDLENEMDMFGESLPANEVAQLNAKMILLRKTIKEYNGDDGMAETAQKSIVSWTDLNKVLTDTAALFKQAGEAIGGMFGDALKMVGKFTTSIVQAGNALEAFKEAKETNDKVGMLTSSLTIAGAAVSVVSEVAGKIKEAKERTEEVDRATQAYYRTLRQIEDSKAFENLSNAFGSDVFGQFVLNMQTAAQAGNSLENISKNISKETVTIKNWGKAIAYAATGWGTLLGISTAAGGKSITSDLISDMRTEWQKFWGSDKNIITASMSEFFDSNGNLLGNKLQKWYETYGEGLTEANKKVVEDMLDEFNRFENAKSGIKGFLSNLFGNVAQDVASDMVDTFVETGHVIQDMSKYMDDFAKSVAKSIVQGKLMAKVFKEEDEEAIADLLVAGKTSDAIKSFNNLMEKARDMAPEIEEFLAGLDLQSLGSDNATASSKGFAAMSQETGDELNGRFTALQISNETIAQNSLVQTGYLLTIKDLMTGSSSVLTDIRDMHAIEASYLADIAKQTKPIPVMADTIDRIKRNTENL